MSQLVEGIHAAEFLCGQRNTAAVEHGTILSGQKLKAGQVLGAIAVGAATMTAFSNNAGGTGAAAAVTVSAGAKPGTYKVTVIEPGTNAGVFQLEDPDGVIVKTGVIGQAFSGGGLAFTIPDGATDFIAGEGFNIAVAAGSGKYRAIDFSSAVGADAAVGLLLADVDATAADARGVVVVRDQEFVSASVVWPVGATSPQKAAALAQLKRLGLIAR